MSRPDLVPRLGAVPHTGGGVDFAVWSRGDRVELCLAEESGSPTDRSRHPMRRRTDGVWTTHLPWVRAGDRYGFRVHGPWDPVHGHRFDPGELLVDPYARAIDRQWSVVVDGGFDWGPDAPPRVPWPDTVLYELHVRGFTKLHPAVPAELRGTYAGLAHPDSIGHLTDLGVTTLELLPVHHFRSEPALVRPREGQLLGLQHARLLRAARGLRGGRVTRRAGARVQGHGPRRCTRPVSRSLLDVVYNHTCEGGADGPTTSWRGLDNEAYYRLRHDGTFEDVTGCGNSLDLRHPRCLAMVTDSLRYWVQEMHVDGFRFDLAPTLARGTSGFEQAGTFLAVVGQDPVLSRVKLVAEPWDVGPGGYQLGAFPAPWAEWNDRFRDTVREVWLGSHGQAGSRSRRCPRPGLRAQRLVRRLRAQWPRPARVGQLRHRPRRLHPARPGLLRPQAQRGQRRGRPRRVATTTGRWNCGVEGPTDDPDVLALRGRLSRSLLATLLLSAGVPMLTAGDETGRTQGGNNNAYCLDDETTWVSWEHKPWQRDLYGWTRALLALRRDHPVAAARALLRRSSALAEGSPPPLAWFGADGAPMTAERWFDHDQRIIGHVRRRPAASGSRLRRSAVNTGAPSVLPGDPVGGRLRGAARHRRRAAHGRGRPLDAGTPVDARPVDRPGPARPPADRQRRTPLSIPALSAGRVARPSSPGPVVSRCRGTIRAV